MEEKNRYSISYRSSETSQVMEWIKAGQCGCLIGMYGAGKSNFTHFLFREDVRSHYLGQQYTDSVFVLVDLLSLVEISNWAVYELIMNRLLVQLRSLGVEDTAINDVASLHQKVASVRDFLAAQRAVEQCVDIICHKLNRKIVFFFDEFEPVFQTCDPSLFRCLRAIRDAHKGQVSYIVVVANELIDLRDNLDETEPFYSLVSNDLCNLEPLNDADARQTTVYLAAQRSLELAEPKIARLVYLSGGHAGLLKALLSLLCSAECERDFSKLDVLITEGMAVQKECRNIWKNFSGIEQTALISCANKDPITPPLLRHLKTKGAIRKDDSAIFSPIFAAFVQKQAPPPTTGTLISRLPRLVQLDGQRIETLTEMEFEVLCYLYEQRGRVCTKYDLIENVYRQRYANLQGGVTDASLQALISRLRKKIEPDCERPRYVVTVQGEGYRFVEPNKD